MKQVANGDMPFNCKVAAEWESVKGKITETHATSVTLAEYLPHLKKLDALEDIKDHLMRAATGKDQIDIGVAKMLFKILGITITALLFIIVFLLTGSHWGFLGSMHK